MRRKMIPTTTGVTIIGRMRVPRIARTNRTSRRQSRANARPSAVSIATAIATNSTVVTTEPRKAGSEKACV
jgi:hypothetical protein